MTNNKLDKKPQKRKITSQHAVKRSKSDDTSKTTLVCHLTAPADAPAVDFGDDELLLPRLLNPLPVAEFKSKYFHRHPLHISATSIDRIEPVLQTFLGGDVEAIVENTASDRIHVWCEDKDTGKLQSIALDEPASAVHLHAAGHSVYCRAPAEVEDAVVRKLLTELGLGIRPTSSDRFTRGEIEMFCSKKGHVTGFHSDFQENFTIQLKGSKRWYIRPTTVQHPLRGCTPHYDSPEVAEQQLKAHHLADGDFAFKQFESPEAVAGEQVFEVRPGDVLYHPAGCWHRVECLEDSVSMNVSLIASSYADIFASGLTQLLWSDPAWRCQVDTSSRADTLSHLNNLLDGLRTQLNRCHAEWFLPPMICNSEQMDLSSASCTDSGASEHHEHDAVSDCCNIENCSHDQDDAHSDGSEDGSGGAAHMLYVGDINIDDDELSTFTDERTLLHFNPLATVLRGTDLAVVGWERQVEEAHAVYVCHVGYGNESLDSISSSAIAVPDVFSSVMETVIASSQQAKSSRGGVSVVIGELVSKKLRKSKSVLVTQFLKALEFTGVVYRR